MGVLLLAVHASQNTCACPPCQLSGDDLCTRSLTMSRSVYIHQVSMHLISMSKVSAYFMEYTAWCVVERCSSDVLYAFLNTWL